jgi:hypothetical protein
MSRNHTSAWEFLPTPTVDLGAPRPGSVGCSRDLVDLGVPARPAAAAIQGSLCPRQRDGAVRIGEQSSCLVTEGRAS